MKIFALIVAAAVTQQEKMQSARWLVGTWTCHHTVGDFAGEYKTTYAAILGDHFLRQTYDFPADKEEPARQADSFIGWSPRGYWERFFVMSTGDIFANRMTDTATGWAWKYVSFSKNRKPESDEPDAVFTRKSDSEYTIDGPSYEKAPGVRVTEHHLCRKM